MIGSGSIKGCVAGLAVWLPGRHSWLVPGLVLDPELGGATWVGLWGRALRPCLAINIPLALSRPSFKRSRRLVSPALISSCRFLNAATICVHRALETLSPNTLKYTRHLLSSGDWRRRYVQSTRRVNREQLAGTAFY